MCVGVDVQEYHVEGIGKRIRLERLRLGLSQAKFAHIGGVAANAQGHYESGYRKPKADYLFKLAGVGVDISFLVTGSRPASAAELQLASTRSLYPQADTPYPAADQYEAKAIEHLHQSLWTIASALVDLHQLKDHDDPRTPEDHLREYLSVLDAEAR